MERPFGYASSVVHPVISVGSDVKRDSDIRTRWLASQKDYRRLEDINRTQADFRYLFPCEYSSELIDNLLSSFSVATPVSATLLSQHETEPDTDVSLALGFHQIRFVLDAFRDSLVGQTARLYLKKSPKY